MLRGLSFSDGLADNISKCTGAVPHSAINEIRYSLFQPI